MVAEQLVCTVPGCNEDHAALGEEGQALLATHGHVMVGGQPWVGVPATENGYRVPLGPVELVRGPTDLRGRSAIGWYAVDVTGAEWGRLIGYDNRGVFEPPAKVEHSEPYDLLSTRDVVRRYAKWYDDGQESFNLDRQTMLTLILAARYGGVDNAVAEQTAKTMPAPPPTPTIGELLVLAQNADSAHRDDLATSYLDLAAALVERSR